MLPDDVLVRLDELARSASADATSPWAAVAALVTEVRALRSRVESLGQQLEYAEQRDETRETRWRRAFDSMMEQLSDQEVALVRAEIARARLDALEAAVAAHRRQRQPGVRRPDRVDEALWAVLDEP